MECAVCTDVIPSAAFAIKCLDHFCQHVICHGCMREYCQHAVSVSLLPVCVAQNCKAIYPFSQVVALDRDTVDRYVEACYLSLLVTDRAKIEAEERMKQILDDMKKEKLRYVQTAFPRAIAIVAEITCKSKLSKIKKSRLQKKKAARVCMNLFCTGSLDDNLQCEKCMTQFCPKCELVLEANHVCKTEDVETLQAIRELPKCPKCGLSVDKDNGCDHVRCAVCGTKFYYNTDRLGGHGGHTVSVDTRESISLTVEYKDRLSPDMISPILELEEVQKREVSYQPVKSALATILNGKGVTKTLLARKIEQYYKNKYLVIRCARYLTEIEKLLKANSLTMEVFDKVSLT